MRFTLISSDSLPVSSTQSASDSGKRCANYTNWRVVFRACRVLSGPRETTEQRKIPAGVTNKLFPHTMKGKQENKVLTSYPTQNEANDSSPMPRPRGTYGTKAEMLTCLSPAYTHHQGNERRESL